MKDFLRGSRLQIDSTWYRLKNGKKIPLRVVAKYGCGIKNEFRVNIYEFEHMRTGRHFNLPWLQAIEMLEEGTLIPNNDC